jgi:hypothetical protein
VAGVLGCRVFGHRYRFRAEGETMIWVCARGCGAGGSKGYASAADASRYASAADASRYASAFDREDSSDLGKRAPFLGMFPLRIWRTLRRRS